MIYTDWDKELNTNFSPKDDFFNFAYKEKSGSGDTDFNYGDLPQKSSIQVSLEQFFIQD